jgi:hypothetical protein
MSPAAVIVPCTEPGMSPAVVIAPCTEPGMSPAAVIAPCTDPGMSLAVATVLCENLPIPIYILHVQDAYSGDILKLQITILIKSLKYKKYE